MGDLRRTLRNLLPSMFHRRLLLLTGAMLTVLLVLGAQMTRLATGQSHKDAVATAESKLERQQLIQTKRGAILDRNGLVLAEDEPGWELAVHFDLLTGRWSHKHAYADASRDKLAWSEMSQAQRQARVDELQLEYERLAQEMLVTLGEFSGIGFVELNARCEQTVERIQTMQNYLWERWRQKAEEERGEPVSLSEVSKPIEAETQHHVLISDLPDELRLLVENFINEGQRAQRSGGEQSRSALPWTMVQLRRTTLRRYPMDRMTVELDRSTLPGPLAKDETIQVEVAGVGLHLIGLMRDAWYEDVADQPLRPRGGGFDLRGYADGDRIGRSGIEQSMESVLRGSRGVRTVNRDTGETAYQTDRQPGQDVLLALDIRLQAHIQAIMSPEFELMTVLPWHLKTDDPPDRLGERYNGAAVVVDIASGDVLAAVSMPDAPRDLLAEDSDLLWNDLINLPMVNRAVAVPYQPGSIMKPMVAAAALMDGVLGVNEKVSTPGYLWENNPTVYRDWLFKLTGWQSLEDANGGPIDVVYAIARSSNVFFGKMAERLITRYSLDQLPQWYRQFGLDTRPDIGLPEAINGLMGNRDGSLLQHNQVCFMAIGQGPVTCTPLQAATAYMRLTSGDMGKQPRLIVSPDRPQASEVEATTNPAPSLKPAYIDAILEGMRQGANESIGTTHHITHGPSGLNNELIFNVEGVTIMAKSGTADPGTFRWIDFNRNGQREEGEIERDLRDHAWVVALVQPDGAPKPTHAVAVVVEYAGSGGRIAGPIVNQIVHALQRHQYLEWPPTR